MPLDFRSFEVPDDAIDAFADRFPHVLPHVSHFRDQAISSRGRRNELNRRDESLRQRIDKAKIELGRLDKQYMKTRTKRPTDWDSEQNKIIAAARAERERISAELKLIPPDIETVIAEWCAGAIRQNWRPVEFVEGDADMVAHAELNLDEATAKESSIMYADRDVAEVHDLLKSQYEIGKQRGKLDFAALFAGGEIDRNGGFRPINPNNTVELPKMPVITDGGDAALVPDAWSIMCAADSDGRFLQYLLDGASEHAKGRKTIPLRDKPAMLAEVRAKTLFAQRQLDACYRAAEAKGVAVKRRSLPVPVLLWIEPIRAPKA